MSTTKPIKVSSLAGPALDWAVAKCEGEPVRIESGRVLPAHSQFMPASIDYSSDWSLAGPIIEREKMAHWFDEESNDYAASGPLLMNTPIESESFYDIPPPTHGPTPLVAAMRCYVASKLGDTVEIPEELI